MTNLPDLLNSMGLTRGSFYKAFEDKRSIYLAALDHYDQAIVSRTVTALAQDEGVPLADHFMMLFSTDEDGASEQSARGCFICNAMVELAPTDGDVAAKTNAMSNRLYEAILDVLVRRMPERSTPLLQSRATAILHLYFGAQAVGKAGQSSHDWRALIEDLLS